MSLALIAAVALQGGELHLRGPQGDVEIRNFATLAGTFGPGLKQVTGNPVQVLWHDAGLSLQGKSAGVDLQLNSTGDYYVRTGELTGGASLTLDSALAYRYEVNRARDAGALAPPAPPQADNVIFTTDRLSYAGDQDQGVLTIPSSFTGTYDLTRTLPNRLSVTMQVIGSSGTFELGTHARREKIALRTGTVAGPVTVRYSQAAANGAVELLANGDRMTMRFIGDDRSIRLAGNVKITGSGQGYKGDASGSEAVLILGKDNELKEFRMTGSPTRTNVEAQNKGGGR